jgi:hypothetical protein
MTMRPLTPEQISTATTNPDRDIVAVIVLRKKDVDRLTLENNGLGYYETLGVIESLRNMLLAGRMGEVLAYNGYEVGKKPKDDQPAEK